MTQFSNAQVALQAAVKLAAERPSRSASTRDVTFDATDFPRWLDANTPPPPDQPAGELG